MPQRIRYFAMILMLVVLGFLAASGCGSRQDSASESDPGEPVPGGTAVVALASEPDVLNSLVRTSAAAGMVLSLLQSSLVEMGEDLTWEPMIASHWAVAPDSLSIVYHMRPWRWSDGVALTSADVALSFELLRDPQIGSPRMDLLRDVVEVSTPDSATVCYYFARRIPDPVQATFHAVVPAHIVATLDRRAIGSWPLNRAPIASGPFRLADWEPGLQLVLEPNPFYPLDRPLLDRLVLRIVPDATARILALEAGEVDLVANVSPNAAKRLATNPTIRIDEVSGRVFAFLMWNVRRVELADPLVRRALSLAIERTRFVDDLLSGYAEPAASYLPPSLWNHHHGLEADPFRPDSAAALLDEAGWIDKDGDGVRERGGQTLSLEILYRSGDSLNENGAVVLRQNFADIGVDVMLRSAELATAVDFLRRGQFDAYWGEFQANLYADPSPLVRSGATDRFNFGGYANARVDSLLDAALAVSDRSEAQPLWEAIQEELARDQPAALVYYPRQVVATSRRLQDVRPHMLSPLNNAVEWWIAPHDRHWAAGPASK